ncbi:hypothetical protein AX17_001234 [Amanita inopinata Kibby_2008]|nr:hypothetical protein AX17_001234 [Amanita inopinata Kibby_2008]
MALLSLDVLRGLIELPFMVNSHTVFHFDLPFLWLLACPSAARPQPEAMNDAPKLTKATLIGILVAITGNVLISFALNLQKLAHKRLNYERLGRSHSSASAGQSTNQSSALDSEPLRADGHSGAENGYGEHPHTGLSTPPSVVTSPRAAGIGLDYGTLPGIHLPSSPRSSTDPSSHVKVVPLIAEDVALVHSISIKHIASAPEENWNESRYLRSKIWWLGFLLMNVGEAGNFISYAYAPASVVAPLGTFALISNCIFAPCMLGEQFKKRDLLGICLAIIGAVTVVLASSASEVKMDPNRLRHAVMQYPFIIYSSIYALGAMLLATLSRTELGQNWVIIDVGLCALFGGFTVLSTKALSTLLTTEWIDVFKQWITYPILAVLIATGIGQIRYLNRALMRFDSKVVIPIQFVLFTLSAIVGSAILYGDFKKAGFHQTVTFLYGVAATFAGVFTIAWAPNNNQQPSVERIAGVTNATPPNDESRGGIGRRRRMTLVGSGGRDVPSLRRRNSNMNLVGLSPAKHLLLVNSLPREPVNENECECDIERNAPSPSTSNLQRVSTPFEYRVFSSNNATTTTRESSLTGRYSSVGGVDAMDITASVL